MKRLVARLIIVLLAAAAWQALTADVLMAQEARDATPAANDGELSEAEIRDLMVEKSIANFKAHSGRLQSYLNSIECGEYNHMKGPPVICDPSDIPAEMVDEYRERQERLRSTFLTEPQPKF